MGDSLRFMTCGSVDDGKSTLIGHLLYEAKMLFADQEKSLEIAEGSAELDYSLILDGLSAEREQGITIDVAYRYFATEKRSFVVADTPGHEEYTRNMAVAASQSELAVLLVDATKGLRTQTGRHLRICEMMGIRDYVFAVNKMDAVEYSREVFRRIESELEALVSSVEQTSEHSPDRRTITTIPLSALKGDNVIRRSANMDWYDGPGLLEYLEEVEVAGTQEEGFIMPVQRAGRFGDRRGLQGSIAAGKICTGHEVTVYPGRAKARVDGIYTSGAAGEAGAAGVAEKGAAVTITFSEDLDISRGYVLAKDTELRCTDMFQSEILWMDEEALTEGKTYLLKLASQTVNVSILKIKYEVDPESGKHLASRRVEKNEIACVDIACHDDLVFDSFEKHRAMGRFILIDKVRGSTAGCGTIMYPLRRAENLRLQDHDITRRERAKALSQRPVTIWFTGLPGSGKSAVANELEKILAGRGRHTMLLDGDNLRLGINRDLGFNDYDRRENIRRVAEISRLMNDAGIIVMTAFISPFEEDRKMAKEIIGEDDFAEVYLSTPIEECERRDAKGLYKKAREGQIPNFTGIGSPYEIPEAPDAEIDTSGRDAAEVAFELYEKLRNIFHE